MMKGNTNNETIIDVKVHDMPIVAEDAKVDLELSIAWIFLTVVGLRSIPSVAALVAAADTTTPICVGVKLARTVSIDAATLGVGVYVPPTAIEVDPTMLT